MAVKQIQLRGISRTPSDRMTRDGGLAESLNMQLDGEELAPMRLPDDVTSELLANYPAYAAGDKVVYIHHGNGYTNYIVEVQGGVFALFEGGATAQTLMNNDSVERATTMGNALIIRYASGTVNNFIYKDGRYLYLDLAALDLGAEFQVVREQLAPNVDWFEPAEPSSDLLPIWNFNTAVWQLLLSSAPSALNDTDRERLALIREYQQSMWGIHDALREQARVANGAFTVPVLARYAVRLCDGSYGFVSAPVLLGAIEEQTMRVYTSQAQSNHRFMVATPYPWLGRLKFGASLPTNWKEYVASVDIFLSEDIEYPSHEADIVAPGTNGYLVFEGEQDDKKAAAAKEALLSAANFYRIASLSPEEVEALGTSGYYDLMTNKENGRQDYRVTQPRFAEDTRYGLVPLGLMSYNGRLFALGSSYELKANYGFMFGPAGEAYMRTISDYTPYKHQYNIRFYINKGGIEYTVDAKNGSSAVIGSTSTSHGWVALFFPDPDCYKVEFIRVDTGVRITVKMEEHPNLNCSYAFFGFGKNLINQTSDGEEAFSGSAGSVVTERNKLSMTRTDNPFVYELGNTQTFDDDIIDAATIAKALITNPYGLADIYVFTKGGIYSIGLMRDGSFNNIHPYTRDVLIPGTLAMIDHAVVFTTEKGVMLLSESGLQDISQVMRGKHDPLPAAAASLLNGDEQYRSLVPAATTTEPFMAFMKGARAAYDYAGKRLLFFNDAYLYQYVFMLETATWHKTDMVGADSYTILNSHPQCLVGVTAQAKTLLLLTSISDYPADVDTVARIIAAAAPSSAGLEWRDISADIIEMGLPWTCDVTGWSQESLDTIDNDIDQAGLGSIDYENVNGYSAVMDLSTLLDDGDYITETGHVVKGLVVTRPLAFDAPDIRKVLKDLRIRTQANRTDVKYILLASMDGKTWKRLTSRGGGSFKWFKIVLVTSLSPIERIGWLDVDVETRYTNKLR